MKQGLGYYFKAGHPVGCHAQTTGLFFVYGVGRSTGNTEWCLAWSSWSGSSDEAVRTLQKPVRKNNSNCRCVGLIFQSTCSPAGLINKLIEVKFPFSAHSKSLDTLAGDQSFFFNMMSLGLVRISLVIWAWNISTKYRPMHISDTQRFGALIVWSPSETAVVPVSQDEGRAHNILVVEQLYKTHSQLLSTPTRKYRHNYWIRQIEVSKERVITA